MRSLLNILILLLFAKVCLGQTTYNGQLISALSNKPIKNALIENQHGKIIGGSDSLGFFNISVDSANNIVLIVISPNGNYDTVISVTDNKPLVLILNQVCEYNGVVAKRDIQNNEVKLICVMGFTGKPFSKKEKRLEKKYNLTYIIFGCTEITLECFEQYNQTTAKYLDNKYGTKWRSKIRKDVTGLN